MPLGIAIYGQNIVVGSSGPVCGHSYSDIYIIEPTWYLYLTAMTHMNCNTHCHIPPTAMIHMTCDTACLTLYHPLLDTTPPTAITHMSCETACLTLYHSLSDTSLTAMIHLSWDTHCLTCVSCQEELASGTFLQASADALMMKSLTDSLPPVLANTSFSSLRSLELKLKHDVALG